jgi:hypothetical protein
MPTSTHQAIADVVFCWWSHPISETLAGAYPMVKAMAYVALTGISVGMHK